MKILLISILIIVTLALGGWWLGKTTAINTSTTTDTSAISTNSVQKNSVKEFDRVISGFAYNPNSIDVNLGDQVVVNITNNDDVTHGINLPAFGVAEFVEPGTTKRIEFLADKTGSPELFCSSDHGEKLLINVKG